MIYIPEYTSKFDLSSLPESPRPLLKRGFSAFSPDAISEILKRVEKFDILHDSVVLAGNSITVSLIVAALAKEFGEFDVWLWDAVSRRYVQRNFSFFKENHAV